MSRKSSKNGKLIQRQCIVCRGTKKVLRVNNGPMGIDLSHRPESCPFCNGEGYVFVSPKKIEAKIKQDYLPFFK